MNKQPRAFRTNSLKWVAISLITIICILSVEIAQACGGNGNVILHCEDGTFQQNSWDGLWHRNTPKEGCIDLSPLEARLNSLIVSNPECLARNGSIKRTFTGISFGPRCQDGQYDPNKDAVLYVEVAPNNEKNVQMFGQRIEWHPNEACYKESVLQEGNYLIRVITTPKICINGDNFCGNPYSVSAILLIHQEVNAGRFGLLIITLFTLVVGLFFGKYSGQKAFAHNRFKLFELFSSIKTGCILFVLLPLFLIFLWFFWQHMLFVSGMAYMIARAIFIKAPRFPIFLVECFIVTFTVSLVVTQLWLWAQKRKDKIAFIEAG